MPSIRKIVLTPVKWVSRKIIHHTILRFPGGEKPGALACTYCPELCRFSCSSAVVTGNDAVTPSNKMGLLYRMKRWPEEQKQATQGAFPWPIYDCTGCGRCTQYCIYQVPVAETLFDVRKNHPHPLAESLVNQWETAQDPYGEMHAELGLLERAQRRLEAATAKLGGAVVEVDEPKTVHYLGYQGVSVALSWQSALMVGEDHPAWKTWTARLSGRRWLVAESSWLNRRLGRSEQVALWCQRAIQNGVELVLPFQNGLDCIDTGGEGAYSLLFPSQAKQMALDFWERDCHRADGVLCFSERQAQHFRGALQGISGKIPEVMSVSDLFVKSRREENGISH